MDKDLKKLDIIILLAGAGKRISGYTKKPKCLIKINHKSILSKNMLIWKSLGLRKLNVVLGYKNKLVKEELKSYENLFKINKSYNKSFLSKGNTYSLYLGLKKIHGPVLIFDGDLIYDKKILSSFLSSAQLNSILVGPGKAGDLECAKVLLDKKGNVKKIVDKESIKKERYKHLRFLGEAIGIIKLSYNHVKKLKKALKIFLSKDENLNLNWEKAFNFFLKTNHLNYYFTRSKKWIEIDDKQDLIKAIKLVKKYNI